MPQSPAYWPKAFSTAHAAFSEESRALASKLRDPRKERVTGESKEKRRTKTKARYSESSSCCDRERPELGSQRPGSYPHCAAESHIVTGKLEVSSKSLLPCLSPLPCPEANRLSHLQGLGDQLEKVLRISRNPAGHGHCYPQLCLFWGSQRDHWPPPDPPPWLAPSEGGPNCAPSHCSLCKGP